MRRTSGRVETRYVVFRQRVEGARARVLNTSIERVIRATTIWWSVALATGTVREFSVEEQGVR